MQDASELRAPNPRYGLPIVAVVLTAWFAPFSALRATPPCQADFPSKERGAYIAETADTGPFVPVVEPAATLVRGEVSVRVGAGGGMQIDTGTDSYLVESCFTYPGSDRLPDGKVDWKNGRIGWNGLPRGFSQDNYPDVAEALGNEAAWKPELEQTSDYSASLRAEGKCYRLLRTVNVMDNRIDIADTFTNKREYPTGVVPRHRVTARTDYCARFAVNLEVAANPTLFLGGTLNSLGLVMQDNVSRRRMRPWVPRSGNRCGFQINRVALGEGRAHTFAWSIYVLPRDHGYFDFVNRVRRDWKANFTIPGPFCFAYLRPEADDVKFYLLYGKPFYLSQIRTDPTEFTRYLAWRGSRILAVAPWLDHDPGAMNHVVTWDEYRMLMKQFLPVMRQVAPDLRVLACIETDWVAIRPDTMDGGDRIPLPDQSARTGPSVVQTLTPEISRLIEAAMPAWHDSLVRTAKGELKIYHYYRGGAPINDPPLHVYPELGNKRYEYMLAQVELAVGELGLDGVYFDEFALGQLGSKRTYGGWDGLSAETCFRTGECHGEYRDCSLAGIQARVRLIEYVRSRGKLVVANRHATSRDEQSLPAVRFTETNSCFANVDWQAGQEPPAINYMFFSHLNSPLGLGICPAPDGVDPGEWLMRGIITYLRHGMVFYHYGPREPPMTEQYRDAFGVVKHMFPITPAELGKGFIVGRERVLTTVSMDRVWPRDKEPGVLLFGADGNRIEPGSRCTVRREHGGWRLLLGLRDWAEVAVVE